MRSCNEMHLMERLKRGLTPQVSCHLHLASRHTGWHFTFCMQLESVGRIFDEHRRQDILMIEERDEIQRSYQEENEDYQECIWMYDSNLCREILKCGFVRRCRSFCFDSQYYVATT
jgi:hypothetical protein